MAEIILQGENGIYRFDPEDLNTKIGQGGMGVVFKGVCIENNKDVAIKVLYREITSNISNVERERQSASIRLQHPNLVQMLDFIELNSIYHIVSEYIEGKSLHQLLEEKKINGTTFSTSESKDIILAVLNGLDGLHKAGVIHRDIDPSNIFIGNDGVVKIMDFGIAKISDGKRKSLTGIGTIIGKPHYSSPEQIKGDSSKVSPASDLYSLGITYYEMLTGDPPFNATNEYDLMKMQIENLLPNNKLIPTKIFSLLQKATEKDPRERFHSSQEFLNALNPIFTESTVIKRSKKSKSVLVIFLTLLIAVLMIVLVLLLYYVDTNQNKLTKYINENANYVKENIDLKKGYSDLQTELVKLKVDYSVLNYKYKDALQLKFDIPINIIDIQFANRDRDSKMLLTDYGSALYSNKLKFLCARISFINLSNNLTFRLKIKIIKDDGSIFQGDNSPLGYSYVVDIGASSGFGSKMTNIEFPTRYGSDQASFLPGSYTYEVYSSDGILLISKNLIIY